MSTRFLNLQLFLALAAVSARNDSPPSSDRAWSPPGDTRKWYVMANFREAEVLHMAPDREAIVYLSSAPNRPFRGKVQGRGWAVKPKGEIDLPRGDGPYVKRELNWARVAQRFPVRIEVENPDPDLFRMGASAVAIIKTRASNNA